MIFYAFQAFFALTKRTRMNPNDFGFVWTRLVRKNAPKGQFTHSPRQAQRRLGYTYAKYDNAPKGQLNKNSH